MTESIPIPYDQQGKPKESEANYEPSPEEKKTIRLVEKLFSKAKAARKPYEEKWLDNYRMFRGRQWKDARPSYRHSEVVNLIFRAIQSEVPILVDGRPKPEFVPQEPGDLALAQILNDIFDSDWNSGNWLFKLTEIVYDAHFYGASFGSLKFDPAADNGKGKIIFQSEDCISSYPDPQARNVNEDANYFIFAEARDVESLKREYPHIAHFIKPDLLDFTKRDRANFSEQTIYKSPSDSSRSVYEGNVDGYGLEARDQALKIELYIHDTEYIEEEVESKDPNSGEPGLAYVQKLKYPNGRKICLIGNILAADGPIETEDKKFPYVKLINYILPREFWGISEVEQLESPQKIFNKLVSFALDVLTLMGNPVWVVDKSSGVDTDNLFNRPGLIIEKEPGSEVTRQEGVNLQPYVLQMIDRMKMWFDDVSGSNDVSRGVKPEGVTAASAITALQEAAQTRLRQKTRNIDAFMQDFGKMYLSRAFQYYDAPRVFRVTGSNDVTRFFKFHVEKQPAVDEMGQPTGEYNKLIKIRPFQEGVDGQSYYGDEQVYQAQGDFDVRISTGSSLPFEKERIESQSYQLFDRGIIDAEEVLKNLKYPNAEAVLKRQAEKAMMAAQTEAMGQAPPQV